jgi:hypothetical protein
MGQKLGRVVVQGGADYKKSRRQQFASQLRFFRQLCTAAKVLLAFFSADVATVTMTE